MSRRDEFLALHVPGDPVVMANAWDAGTAKVLAHLGFRALATTSAGFAASLGRHDGAVTRDEAIAHTAALAGAMDRPLNADLEHCFAATSEEVAHTIALALGAGAAGVSIEDWDPVTRRIYDIDEATERVAAAAVAAHAGPGRLVLTARAENLLHGVDDLADTITRLQAYEAAGADVLYAPGLVAAADIERVVASLSMPVNVLVLPGAPSVPELAGLGVARVSVGSAFSLVAYGALANAARELLDEGTYRFWDTAAAGRALRPAFD
jgi:2-methylisocitrate lyase-like PEP mutase family enzyme